MGLVRVEPPIASNTEPISENAIATACKDTFINRTAIIPVAYPEIYGTLLSYSEGVPVSVEYFKKRVPYINTQTIDTSFSLERAAVHFSYDLVHNFEIRIKDQLNIVIDPETTETSITGEATIYPGFKPNAGDAFYLALPDAKVGVFVVDLVTPLSINRGTNFAISFHLYSYIDAQLDAKLRTAVVEELHFDKQSYFSDEAALLSDTSYNQLNSLLTSRQSIVRFIVAKFYNVDEKTVVRPDGLYDPHVVEYLTNKISITESRSDICQLSNLYNDRFEKSIWYSILNNDITKLSRLGYLKCSYRQFLWDTIISDMDRHFIVALKEGQDVTGDYKLTPTLFDVTDADIHTVSYHFSNRFYLALLKSFDRAKAIDDVVPYLPELDTDQRISVNLTDQFYSVSDDAIHDISFFDIHSKSTGSNNDIHLPEIEYMIFDYLVNDNVDTAYLVDKVLSKFPFVNMSPLDRFYNLPALLHLIDVAIPRIR